MYWLISLEGNIVAEMEKIYKGSNLTSNDNISIFKGILNT